MRQILLVACFGLVFAGTACGSDKADRASGPAATAEMRQASQPTDTAAAEPAPAPSGVKIEVRDSDYGKMLFDSRGRALYLFTKDSGERSRCYGGCADAWPPLHTKGEPRAGDGVRQGLLGTVRRKNGKIQATYRGHPLYRYVGDREPGQVLCQDVEEFGGHWWVVAPNGRAIT